MAGKVKMPNKKTTITVAIIIAILAVVIAIGTVVFLKDRGSTEAAEIESNQFAEQENGTTGNVPAEQNNGEVAGNQGTLPNAGEQANAENEQNPAGGVANANNGGVQNNQIAGNAGQNAAADNIQETTIQRTETVEIPERQTLEGHYVGWTPMSVNADLNYAKLINAKKDNLEINKICDTKTGENTTTRGEVITYKISVKNNSEKDLEGIEVKDLIPEMTTYVENSSNFEATELTGKDGKTVIALKWNIDLKAGEAIEISFQVKVSDTATGTIKNVAVVNGEETNETHTAIVTSTKTAEVIGKTAKEPAKVGDKIKYTITVKNTGDIAGKANVKDEALAKLIEDGILEVEESSKETAEKLMAGTDVEVAADSESKVEFTVVVKKVSGAIKNVATVGEEKPEETVDTTDYTIKKEVTSTAKNENGKYALGETITYKVTVTNTGNTVLKTVTVNDSNSEEKARTATNIAVGGKAELTFTHIVTEDDIKDKEVVNVATSDGKETEKVTVETEEPFTKYDLVKTVTGTDKDKDGKYDLGETITYKVIVTNKGNQTVENVVVTDNNSEEGTATVNGEIKPGESKEVTFTHIVTEADVKAGKVINVATIGDEPSNEVTTETEDPITKYELDKTVTSTAKNENGKYALGETITYKVTVTNKGNQTVKDIVVKDNNSEEKTATAKGPMAPGESDYVEFTHIVTEQDIKAGKVINVATIEDEPSNEVTTETEDPITKYELEKAVTSTAKNENGKYALGETITYKVTVTNKGNQTVENVVVTDNNSEEGTATAKGPIAPNASAEVTFTHIVTEKDIKAGEVVNVATIGKDPSNEVTTETEDPITKYELHKEVTSTAKNENGKYALGETITYKVTVTNKGNQTVENVVVKDSNSEEGTATVNGEIKPGESKDVTFTHIVTEADIKAGEVVNVATIGDDPSNEVTTETEDPITKYELHKEVTSTAKNENGKYALGETITYKVTVTNKGNQTVENVVVKDSNSEEGTATVNGEIKPGESKDVTFTHIVTEADVKTGKVVNVATIGDEPSNEVTTETEDPNPNFVVTKTATKVNGTNVNGEIAVKVGDIVTYEITVENTGNVTLENVVVTDQLVPEFSHTIPTLNRGTDNKVSVTVEYTVQEKDIKDGKLINIAKATIPEKEETGKEELPVSNIEIEKHVAEYKNGEYTILSKEALESTTYKVGDTVWYAITVTNNGEVADTVTVTDTLATGLAYADEASETINYNRDTKTITWNTQLNANETKTLYIKATITNSAITGTPVNSITTGTSWWKTNNGDITTGKQEAAAKLFIKLDGKILENDQDNHYTDTKDYTGCVAKVNLTAKNLSGDNVQTTDANAIKVGTTVTPTTVEEYSTLNYQIFQYIIDGTDLNTIAENIKNDSKAKAKGITFNPETQMIVCYVLKTESDGYHIDAVIRPKAETKIDLYNVDNIATVNGKDSEKVTIVVTNSTEIAKVTVKKEWANTTSTPESVDVQLYAGANATTEIATLNAKNNWTYTWDELSKYDTNNNEINYSVKEISVDLENKNVTTFENNDTNGDYKVTYATTGNTTTITNTFVKPEINVTKKQYDKNDAEMAVGTKVEYGDTITYKIVATNSGNAEGTVTLKDTIPSNSTLAENTNITLTQGGNTIILTVDELAAGKEVTLGETGTATDTATITFTVEAKAYAGEKVTNTAYYNKDDEDKPTETTQSDIEAKTQVIPTSTSTQVVTKPQKAILVLDFSGSMKGTKLTQLKNAVNSFIDKFMEVNSQNQIMLIEYDKDIINNTPYGFTNNKQALKEKLAKDQADSGTNIDLGLTKANQELAKLSAEEIASTSVILMTDGSPYHYYDDNTNKIVSCSNNKEKGRQEAIESAQRITNRNVPLYAVGFKCSTEARNLMKNIAKTNKDSISNDEKINKYYSEPENGDDLNFVFENIADSIVSEADGEPIEITTAEGKMLIADGFEAGQNVEIYTGVYTKGTSTPKATYSWSEFISSDYVQENEDGTITFDLTQYMKDNNIAASEKITIRFVDPQKANTKMKSARLMSLVIDATEDAESEEDIAEYEQKIEKAEQAKTTPVKEDSKPATTETPNKETTTNNNTVVETENTKPSTDNKENNNKEENKDNTTTTTEKPAETTNNTTTEETINNNKDNNTDNTTSNVNE